MTLGLTLFLSLLQLLFGGDKAEIIFAGDAMQHQAQLDAARASASASKSAYDYSGYFTDIEAEITLADYAVVNLETPIYKPPYSGYPCFNAPKEFAKALKDSGFDLFLTANNHTLDRHSKGLVGTIEQLDALGVEHIGTYRDREQRDSIMPFVKKISGIKFGFLNYTYGTNGIEPDNTVRVDYIDREKIKSDVAKARLKGAEILVVCIHWGDEYKLLPNASQKSLADFLVDLGVDVVMGNHPHVVQPSEIRQRPDGSKALVVYSLGNFVSAMRTRDTRGGQLVKAVFCRDAKGKARILCAGYLPVFTIHPSANNKNYKVVKITTALSDPYAKAHAGQFYNAALQVLDKHNISVNNLLKPSDKK